MKRILTLFFALILVSEGFSQTYQNWDFSTSTVTTFPAGFVTWNLDGQALNTGLTGRMTGMSTTAPWSIDISDFNQPGYYTNSAAVTGSWFVSATVPSSRWLVTPSFTVPSGVPNVGLVWYAQSLGTLLYGNYFDSYRVLVSTTDSNASSFTPLLTVNNETGNQHALGLAAYAGQTIRIAFQDTCLNQVGLLIPSIKVINLPAEGAKISDIEIYEHNHLDSAVVVTGQVTNTGLDTITSFTLNYSVNGAAPITAAITGSYPALQGFYYTHPTLFNPSTAGTYTLKVWFSAINGTGTSSDTATTTLFFYAPVAGLKKNVLIEEFTGAWCGYCPAGAFHIRDLLAAKPYTVAVAIHDQNGGTTANDAMQIPAGDQLNQAYGTGFPDAMVDRVLYFDNHATGVGFYTYSNTPFNVHDTLAAFRYNQATPANVSMSAITFDSTTSTNNLTVTVNATFLNSLSQGDYRLNLIIAEDSIITTGAGYDQHNYYSSAMYGANAVDAGNSPLNALAGIITNDGQPNDWAQNHVLRAMAGGAWGQGGDIPSAPIAGSTYSHTFTTTVPTTWRYKFLKLIGVVQEYNTDVNKRYVLNVTEANLITNPSGIKEISSFNSLTVYPNPASTMAIVQMDMKEGAMVSISVLNTLGQVAIEPSNVLLNAGTHSVNIPVSGLQPGVYFVKVTLNGEVSTLPLSIMAK